MKDGVKGALVWEAKHACIVMKNDDGLPGIDLHLLVAHNAERHERAATCRQSATAETRRTPYWHFGNFLGNIRHWQPVRTTYKIPLTISRL
nr:hypothetical protein [Lacipirellula limnantheis]